jgi:hypothetical protein
VYLVCCWTLDLAMHVLVLLDQTNFPTLPPTCLPIVVMGELHNSVSFHCYHNLYRFLLILMLLYSLGLGFNLIFECNTSSLALLGRILHLLFFFSYMLLRFWFVDLDTFISLFCILPFCFNMPSIKGLNLAIECLGLVIVTFSSYFV